MITMILQAWLTGALLQSCVCMLAAVKLLNDPIAALGEKPNLIVLDPTRDGINPKALQIFREGRIRKVTAGSAYPESDTAFQ